MYALSKGFWQESKERKQDQEKENEAERNVGPLLEGKHEFG